MTKWEYKIHPYQYNSDWGLEAELNILGAEGWELVTVEHTHSRWMLWRNSTDYYL